MATQYNINVTRRCNLRCAHCFVEPEALSSSGRTMSFVSWRMAIDRIAEHVVDRRREDPSDVGVRIQVMGGEPTLLAEDWHEEALRLARGGLAEVGARASFRIASNLTTDRSAEICALYDGASTSWDAGRFPDRRTEAAWEARVRSLSASGIRMGTEVTMLRSVLGRPPEETASRILSLGVRDLHFSAFIPRSWAGDFPGSGDVPSNDEVSAFLIRLARIREALRDEFPDAEVHPVDSALASAAANDPVFSVASDSVCPIHGGSFNVDWDGGVALCTNDGVGGVSERLGDLGTASFSSLVSSEAAIRRRTEAVSPRRVCSGCDEYAACLGGCSLLHRSWDGTGECPGYRTFLSWLRRSARFSRQAPFPNLREAESRA
jgi:radical SAM protein with 4Fe4S-binding SPASM domain